MYKVGIDIGGTKIALGIFKDTDLLCDTRLEVSALKNPTKDIRTALLELCAQNGIDYGTLSFVGVGIPGTVSGDGKTILKAPNIHILNANFADELETALSLPVCMMQDSRAAAWGEYVAGAGKNAKTLLCITLGTGIGTGIVMDGKIYDGALGSAGELGHVSVKEHGRACGCGKCGCLEKYAAGGGLDISAKEWLGDGKTARDLFALAKRGDGHAKAIIAEAVELLGGVIVSALNLLSPDTLLFSGGLCVEEELYLSPLTDYILTHAYAAGGTLPTVKKAALGEKAPLYGAALAPFKDNPIPKVGRRPLLAASLMCADVLHLENALSDIETAGIDYIHCDIMDNHFVPNLMLPPEWLNRVRAATVLPFDYHLMVERPETVIERLDIREGDFVSIHAESTVHLDRVLSLAKDKGAKIAVALNPATPIETLSEILPRLDMVLLMTVNPGFAGQKLVEGALDKIERMKNYLNVRGLSHILLQVDGNCSFESIPKMYRAGADVFVVGTSSVFHRDMTVADATKKVLASC